MMNNYLHFIISSMPKLNVHGGVLRNRSVRWNFSSLLISSLSTASGFVKNMLPAELLEEMITPLVTRAGILKELQTPLYVRWPPAILVDNSKSKTILLKVLPWDLQSVIANPAQHGSYQRQIEIRFCRFEVMLGVGTCIPKLEGNIGSIASDRPCIGVNLGPWI